jgi:hypothetical protein
MVRCGSARRVKGSGFAGFSAFRTSGRWDKQRAVERQGLAASTPFWWLANRNDDEAPGRCARGRIADVLALAGACARNAHGLVLCSCVQGDGLGRCVCESKRDALGGENR